MKLIVRITFSLAIAAVVFYLASWYESLHSNAQALYTAEAVVTMEEPGQRYEAVVVENGKVLALGARDELTEQFPDARIDNRFAGQVIYPGFIDPHVHMLLAAIEYAMIMAPPWDMPLGHGVVKGLENQRDFLRRLEEIVSEYDHEEPIIVYGYHDLVHGKIDRQLLDEISPEKPLIVWHYSTHDFYFNSMGLEWAEISPALSELYVGVELDASGGLTGRIYEDAAKSLLGKLSSRFLNPRSVRKGYQRFAALLERGGVTTVSDLAFGLFNETIENANMLINWRSVKKAGFRIYLVPEYRAIHKKYGDEAVAKMQRWVSGEDYAAAPVLPQVKFFSDGAFYSQTMRVSEPGYLAGQSSGSQGLWVTPPEVLTDIIQPYWDAGIGVRIHSNGDASQDAVLDTLAELRKSDKELRYIIEHAGLFSPESVQRAAELDGAISAASHYVFYLGESLQVPLENPRNQWILPLASHFEAGNRVTVHSDAPLAPPLPLLAASVHVTRATREGNTLTPSEALTPWQALKTITKDAAYALGLEQEIGSLKPGKLADFTVLAQDPMQVDAQDWSDIEVIARVVGGRVHLNSQSASSD